MKHLIKVLLLSLVVINYSYAKDNRIKHYAYKPGVVYRVNANYLIATNIYFPKNEQIVNVTLGDSEAWAADTVQAINMVVLKPKYISNSNMVVTTSNDEGNIKIYPFDLKVTAQRQKEVYYMKFISTSSKSASVKSYPLRKKSSSGVDFKYLAKNNKYTYSGSKNSKSILPKSVWDDGTFTYFEFNEIQPGSTIYAVIDGKEELVNFNTNGNIVIVHRIAERFTIRNGEKVICIFNERYDKRFKSTLKKNRKASKKMSD